MTQHTLKRLLAVSVLLAGISAVEVLAQAADDKSMIDLANLDCREMLKMDSDARDFTLIFYHGFISGQKKEMMFDGDALAAATDQALDHCIDNPNDKLLGVFEKARKD